MRLIKAFAKEDLAQNFSLFLQKEGVRNFLDVEVDDDSKQFSYQVWVYEEDQIASAESLLLEFEKKPATVLFQKTKPSQARAKPLHFRRSLRVHKLTSFILSLCVFIYLINFYQENQIKRAHPKLKYVLLTPVIYWMLFDVPYVLMEYDHLVRQYEIDPHQKLENQNPAFLEEVKKIEDQPYWQGIDELLKRKLKKDPPVTLQAPLFEKIRQGQVWRLFTPAFLHKDLLHLLFNMLWLWILGRPIEEKIKKWRYLTLVLAIALISNVSQYLMSGTSFLGYSGIVMGMVGFIWMRQRLAPWEGYVLQKSVFLFLGAYVFLLLALSLVTFFSEVYGGLLMSVNIANTAHIVGALTGAFLARLSFFKEQA